MNKDQNEEKNRVIWNELEFLTYTAGGWLVWQAFVYNAIRYFCPIPKNLYWKCKNAWRWRPNVNSILTLGPYIFDDELTPWDTKGIIEKASFKIAKSWIRTSLNPGPFIHKGAQTSFFTYARNPSRNGPNMNIYSQDNPVSLFFFVSFFSLACVPCFLSIAKYCFSVRIAGSLKGCIVALATNAFV